MAARASAASPYGTCVMRSSLPGSIRSQVPPPTASTHSPPISCLRGKAFADRFASDTGGALLRVLGEAEGRQRGGHGLVQHRQPLVDLGVGEVQRRQQADAVRVEPGADDDEAALQGLL